MSSPSLTALRVLVPQPNTYGTSPHIVTFFVSRADQAIQTMDIDVPLMPSWTDETWLQRQQDWYLSLTGLSYLSRAQAARVLSVSVGLPSRN